MKRHSYENCLHVHSYAFTYDILGARQTLAHLSFCCSYGVYVIWSKIWWASSFNSYYTQLYSFRLNFICFFDFKNSTKCAEIWFDELKWANIALKCISIGMNKKQKQNSRNKFHGNGPFGLINDFQRTAFKLALTTFSIFAVKESYIFRDRKKMRILCCWFCWHWQCSQ